MPTKEFLPRSTLSIPLNGLKDHLIENGPHVIKLPSKVKPCVKRVVPILGIFSLLFGSAFLGFSVATVEEGHVGYYSSCAQMNGSHCAIKSYPPGIYFEMPWRKGEFKTANVSPRNLTLGKIHGTTRDIGFTTAPCIAEYKVVDLNAYLNALIAFKSDQALDVALIDEVKRHVSEFLRRQDQQPPAFNITYVTYGLSFGRVGFIDP